MRSHYYETMCLGLFKWCIYLLIQSVLPLFRCLATIERNVSRCEISINSPENRVTFQFYCRHGRRPLVHSHTYPVLFSALWTLEGSVFQWHPALLVSGITKTHMLGFQEREALQAVYPYHLCINVLKAQARLALHSQPQANLYGLLNKHTATRRTA